MGSEPIVICASTLHIEIEEPLELECLDDVKKELSSHKPSNNKAGFIDRILDNIKFEVEKVVLKIKTLGKDKKGSPVVTIHLSGIVMDSTNPLWEVVELNQVHKVNEKGEVIMYKEINVKDFSMSIVHDGSQEPISVVDSFPIRVRIKSKKAYFRGPILHFNVLVDLLDEFKLSMHQQEFKCFQDVIDSLLECFNREPPKNNNALDIKEDSVVADEHLTSPKQPSLWGRFTGILGSYKSLYHESDTKEIVPEIQTEKQTVVKYNNDGDDGDDSDDDEFFDSYEDFNELPEEKAITITDDSEDVLFTEYRIRIQKGQFSVYDYLLGERRGIASLTFDNFDCQFIPEVLDVYKSLTGYRPSEEDNFLLSKNPLKSSKINISVFSYSAKILDDSPMYHPQYYNLIERKTDSNGPAQNMLDLSFIRVVNPENPSQQHRELSIYFDSVIIIFDVQIWERIYMFFFEGDKGEKFEQIGRAHV